MNKRIALILALLFSMSCAFSEEFEGKTVFLRTHTVYAAFEGVADKINLTAGEEISEGDPMLSLRTESMYADLDATVRGLAASEGTFLSLEAFQLEPKEKYKLSGSVSYAYDVNENKLVHAGETVYISCVKDATHLAIGYVAQVDDDEFTVYTTHGALYVGEAVNVFRSSDRHYTARIGRATVYAGENTAYEVEGTPVKVYVKEGDRVEKGEILMEYLPGADAPDQKVQYAQADGIVTEVFIQPGDSISMGDKLYEYAVQSEIGISAEISQADMNQIYLGSAANIVLSADPEETPYPAHVSAIQMLTDQIYEVLLMPDQPIPSLREGMTVRVDNRE